MTIAMNYRYGCRKQQHWIRRGRNIAFHSEEPQISRQRELGSCSPGLGASGGCRMRDVTGSVMEPSDRNVAKQCTCWYTSVRAHGSYTVL